MSLEGRELVKSYIDRGFRLVFWPGTGDWKGPREKNWMDRQYTLADYKDGDRVGIMHGVELSPGKYVVDVDVDWGPGVEIAKALLPATQFIWGRSSKRVSHCLYTAPDVIPMYAYKDVGREGRTLIEFRADKHQSMAPPSVWEKDGKREPLGFVVDRELTHCESCAKLKQRVCLAAIGMILAIHFGRNGFGHEARLAWAGALMRLGINDDDLIAMGLAVSKHCNNLELDDIARVVQSTRQNLAADGKKVRGMPALAKHLGEHGKAVVARINEWIGRDSDFVRDSSARIVKDHQYNVRRAVELLGHSLSYNAFSDKMLIDGHPIEDRQMNDLWLKIDEEHHFRPTFAFFEKVVAKLAYDAPFHPVKDYLGNLAWDGVKRLDLWLALCAGVPDSPYTRAVSSIPLVAAVRRIYHPGTKYDEMLVLEGGQGMNKSTAVKALCPDVEWFSDDLPLNTTSQKVIEGTLGKWIVEAADLAGRRRAEIEHLKASMSRQVDGPARMAYAHLPVERPRQFIVIGTTNSSAYLPDSTGARRWWPVTVGRFDVAKLQAMRDQLWAEAKSREAAGESIRLPESLWPVAGKHQEKRREVDPWEQPIREMLLKLDGGTTDRRRTPTDDVWAALNIPVERRDRAGSLRISEIMHRLGFKRTTVRVGETISTGYVTEDRAKLEVPDVERTPGEDDEAEPAAEKGPDVPF